jgi:hypothetical protein
MSASYTGHPAPSPERRKLLGLRSDHPAEEEL